ncbi:MAG: hypothetical protein KGJ66_07550 [Alphaproteobacteria bacterium]|nr:hypothetical protein [Alphaproteobacteria bacterium]
MFNSLRMAVMGGLLAGGLAFAASAGAQPAPAAMTCTNPASGTTWQIKIDYGRRTVDGYPADIGDAEISWFDAKDNGTYTLERKTGKLSFVAASSTGGYFLFDQCRPTAH